MRVFGIKIFIPTFMQAKMKSWCFPSSDGSEKISLKRKQK